jgi:hypothetical protein
VSLREEEWWTAVFQQSVVVVLCEGSVIYVSVDEAFKRGVNQYLMSLQRKGPRTTVLKSSCFVDSCICIVVEERSRVLVSPDLHHG